MKKIIFLIFLFILGGLVLSSFGNSQIAFHNPFYYSVCDTPIKYRVDTVDPKFEISRENFLVQINTAANIWHKVLGKDLFVYDSKGDLSINLIYDERQSLTTEISQLENKIKSDQQALKPQYGQFQKLSAEFKQKVEDLNKEIAYWNSQGGAPSEEYNKLTQKQQELQKEADNLNAMAANLNSSTGEYNTQVKELNQTISTFNAELVERPEEGIYKGPENRIEIYFNVSREELIHTLAHELGHAVGLEHTENANAIMYSKATKKITPTEDDIKMIEDICQKRTIFEILQRRLSYQKL